MYIISIIQWHLVHILRIILTACRESWSRIVVGDVATTLDKNLPLFLSQRLAGMEYYPRRFGICLVPSQSHSFYMDANSRDFSRFLNLQGMQLRLSFCKIWNGQVSLVEIYRFLNVDVLGKQNGLQACAHRLMTSHENNGPKTSHLATYAQP
jgi:hypothetical protein